MTLDAFLLVGQTVELGAWTFEADDIKRFARLFDPQPFHVDEELARGTVFGSLCASGWHTASVWMKLNVRNMVELDARDWSGTGPRPVWGPSPGFETMRWPKPVYAGETVRFTRTVLGQRRLASKPGWRVFTMTGSGVDSQGDAVLAFDGAVLFKAV